MRQLLLSIGICLFLVTTGFGQVTIVEQDFDSGTTWTFSSDVSFFDNGWGSDGYFGTIAFSSASPLNSSDFSGNILGENDLDDEGDNGTTGFANVTFASVEITSYTSVQITFDYDIQGYNATNDDVNYEVFENGVGQGSVIIHDGAGSSDDSEGTITVDIDDSVDSVYVVLSIRNNGGSGYSGFDNFQVTGIAAGSTPTKLVVTEVNGGSSPSVTTGFDVIVQVQDADDNPVTATQDTSVTLSLQTGNGSLGGTLTGTVSNGSSSVTFSNITYDTNESGVSITATNTGGSLSSGTSSTFEVLAAADELVFVSVPSSGTEGVAIGSFTVEARRSGDSSVDLNYTESITISKSSGSGTIGGTTSQSTSSGVATFDDITFSEADDYTIQATDGSLTSSVSSTITISEAPKLIISEVADPADNFDGRFVELFNAGSSTIDFSSTVYYFVRQANGGSLSSIQLTGTLTAGSTYTIADQSDFNSIYGVNPDLDFGSVTGNGDDGYWLATDNTSDATLKSSAFDIYGVVDQDGSGQDWEYEDDRAVRNKNVNSSNSTWTSSEWTITTSVNVADMGEGEHDFGYSVEITGDTGWRLLTIPNTGATGADISDDGIAAQFTSDTDSATIYTYDDTGAFEAITSDATTLTDGHGLAVYFFDNTTAGSSELPLTLDAFGDEPSSDVSVSLNAGAANQFTLVGNPFASNYNTNSITATGGDISDNIAFWSDASGSYSSTDRTASSGYIVSPWQGFWVETSDAAVTGITFPASGATNSDTTGTSFSKEVDSRGDISFTLSSEDSYDGAIRLAFRGYATEEFDRADATKLIPMAATYSTIGFKSNDMLKAVESLPYDLTEETTIEMEQQLVGVSGEFTLDWTGLESIPANWELTFHDYELGTNVDMRAETSYTFEATSESSEKVNPLSMLTGAVAQVQKSKSEDGIRFAITITPNTTSVSNETGDDPIAFELEQNYPNPFNPSTTINYTVASTGTVTLNVYNLMGQKVAELVNATKAAGSYNVSWDASGAASGMYIYRLEAGGQTLTRKMTLIK